MEAAATQIDSSADALPPLLALPDSILTLVAARLPSPDKKAARLVCRALRATVNAAVTSFLLTDTNLPLLAPPDPPKPRQQHLDQPQPAQEQQPAQQQQHQLAGRRGTPLHLAFPNLRHLCLALSPSCGPDTRRAEHLRCLLRHSLPSLRCLRCLDLSLACRDVVLGRTTGEVYDTWATIVEGLPYGRPVRVLLHPPTALGGGSGGAGANGICTAAATAAGVVAAEAANQYLRGRRSGGRELYGGGGGGDGEASGEAIGGGGGGAATGGGGGDSSEGGGNRNSARVGDGGGRMGDGASVSGGGGGGDGSGGGGGLHNRCLLASMLTLLAARRPAAEVRLATAPLASKRYDKPRVPSYAELMEALAPSGGADGSGACPAVTGLVLGPESLDPEGGSGVWALSAPGGGFTGGERGGDGGGGEGAAAAVAGDGLAWLPLLAAANSRAIGGGGGGATLQDLTLWETWPLAALLLGPYGVACRTSTASPSSCCLLGLRRLVLSDQQAVLDRDRLSADALAPLSALTALTRLELASLTISAAAAAAAAAATAARGAAVHGTGRRRGGGGDSSVGRVLWGGGGGGGAGKGRAAAARGGKEAAMARTLPFVPLSQVRHLSVYHALRILWPSDGSEGMYGTVDCGSGGGPSTSYGAGAGAPLAALFPGLRHLSACVTHGSPGRPASERWGYLAGLGSSLTSLHLRAVAAEELCIQGRSGALAALTAVTSLRLSAESGKIDGIRGLARTLACLGPGLVALRLSRLATRGTDPRVAELALPRLTRLDFLGCSGDLVAAFDGLSLSAVRLRRLEVRECETIRPGDLQWALERQMGLTQLVIQDCPGLLASQRGTATRGSAAAAAALRAALRPSLRLSIATTDSAEARTLRHSRRRAEAGSGGGDEPVDDTAEAAVVGPCMYGFRTADDLDEL